MGDGARAFLKPFYLLKTTKANSIKYNSSMMHKLYWFQNDTIKLVSEVQLKYFTLSVICLAKPLVSYSSFFCLKQKSYEKFMTFENTKMETKECGSFTAVYFGSVMRYCCGITGNFTSKPPSVSSSRLGSNQNMIQPPITSKVQILSTIITASGCSILLTRFSSFVNDVRNKVYQQRCTH